MPQGGRPPHLEVVEPLDEHEEGELFDHGKRVGDPAGPERVPDLVDLGFNCTCDHLLPTVIVARFMCMRGAL
ncbi:hypothetical protein NBRC3188_0088 [Acetobacter pasteurianus NBRC 3188]|uniref:Uncharacterized protein n=1 Tax=Acetobacter pasteurianus NBRC 3188 TaxID=1226663 RepID=A0A401WPY8_ACEPA|nr:hypothetical protein NBRC3188_0088 [Acetobacter pasteurianus NBRC 3188]